MVEDIDPNIVCAVVYAVIMCRTPFYPRYDLVPPKGKE